VRHILFSNAGLIEDEVSSTVVRNQLEFDQRVLAGRPRRLAPRLNNPLVRSEFDDTAFDAAASPAMVVPRECDIRPPT
jgi:hypothetical protein